MTELKGYSADEDPTATPVSGYGTIVKSVGISEVAGRGIVMLLETQADITVLLDDDDIAAIAMASQELAKIRRGEAYLEGHIQ